MSEKGRIGAIFGVVAIALIAGLYYFFRIHQPRELRVKAQAEITLWEKRWADARTCVLGATPYPARPAEAIAIRELSGIGKARTVGPDDHFTWTSIPCKDLVGALTRGDAEDTGLAEVEEAWRSIETAAGKFANAYYLHGDAFDGLQELKANRGKESTLGVNLEALDAAHASLRAAAGMEPFARPAVTPLPRVETTPLSDRGDRVKFVDEWTMPSAGGVIARATTTTFKTVEIVVMPSKAPRVLPISKHAHRAVPGFDWFVDDHEDGSSSVASIDDAGTVGTRTTLPPIPFAVPIAAAGTLANGVVAIRTTENVVFAHATSGTWTAGTAYAAGRTTTASDPTGRVLVAWDDPVEDRSFATLIAGEGPPKVIELAKEKHAQGCMTATHAWVGTYKRTVSFDGTTVTPHELPQHNLIGCTADAAFFQSGGDPDHYVVCSGACRPLELAAVGSDVAAVLRGKLHVVRAAGGVIGVWREGGEPLYFATDVRVDPKVAIADGTTMVLLAGTAAGVVVVRLPL